MNEVAALDRAWREFERLLTAIGSYTACVKTDSPYTLSWCKHKRKWSIMVIHKAKATPILDLPLGMKIEMAEYAAALHKAVIESTVGFKDSVVKAIDTLKVEIGDFVDDDETLSIEFRDEHGVPYPNDEEEE